MCSAIQHRFHPLRCGLGGWWLPVCMVGLRLALGTVQAKDGGEANGETTKSILVLEQLSLARPATVDFLSHFRTAVAVTGQTAPVIYAESLDQERFQGDDYLDEFQSWLRKKYEARPMSALVAVGGKSLEYALRLRDNLWPDAPVVYCAVEEAEMGLIQEVTPIRNATGFFWSSDVEGALSSAKGLMPDLRRVLFVSKVSSAMQASDQALRTKAKAYCERNGLAYEETAGEALNEVQSRVKGLAKGSVVFYSGYEGDEAGRAVHPREALAELRKVTAAPIFAATESYIGAGAVGGSCTTFSRTGDEIGSLTQAVLRGGNAASLPPKRGPSEFIFDWRELEQWGLSEKRLPAGSRMLFRPLSVWESYKVIVLAAAVALVIQGLLIIGLLLQRKARRAAESYLRQSEEHMGLASTSAGIGLWIWRLTDDQLWSTELVNSFYGYPKKRLAGADLFARIHPEDRENFRSTWERLSPVMPSNVTEYRVLLPETGEQRWLSSEGRASFDAAGKIRHLTGVTMNVTRRRAMERDLQQHKDQLSHAMRVATMGELSASLAHELNQPLASILWNAETAQRLLEQNPSDFEPVRECIEDIISDEKRAAGVITSLRALFKKDTGKPEARDLQELVTETLALIRMDLSTRGVSVGTELPKAPLVVLADRVQIQQVLINLCMNAAEAMAEVPASERQLSLSARLAEEAFVEVAVQDRGCGLDATQVREMFEPFRTSKPSGLGMGLSICRTIVEAHGGRIWMQSSPGQGATIYFTLQHARPSA